MNMVAALVLGVVALYALLLVARSNTQTIRVAAELTEQSARVASEATELLRWVLSTNADNLTQAHNAFSAAISEASTRTAEAIGSSVSAATFAPPQIHADQGQYERDWVARDAFPPAPAADGFDPTDTDTWLAPQRPDGAYVDQGQGDMTGLPGGVVQWPAPAASSLPQPVQMPSALQLVNAGAGWGAPS